MKKIKTALIIIVLIIGLLSLKNLIFKTILENALNSVSGLKMSIGTIDIGLIKTAISVRGLTFLNSKNFPDRVMFEVPSLYVEYDISSLFKNEIHIKDMRFHLERLNVIKNEDGELNLNSLNIIKFKKGARPKTVIPPIRIDRLHLKIGKVIYKDYTQFPMPKILEYNINLDERYEDIRNPYALGSLIVARALYKTSVSQLTGFDLGPLERELEGIVIGGREIIDRTLKKTRDTLKDIIRLPFAEDERR